VNYQRFTLPGDRALIVVRPNTLVRTYPGEKAKKKRSNETMFKGIAFDKIFQTNSEAKL